MADDRQQQHGGSRQPQSQPQQQPSRAPEAPRKVDTPPAVDPIVQALREGLGSRAQLAGHEIQAAGNGFQSWAIVTKPHHTIADCLSPLYLWNKKDDIRPGDTIEMKHPTLRFVVVLDVVRIDVVARGIVSRIRLVKDYTDDTLMVAPSLSNARVEHLGDRGWAIVDGHHVARDGFDSMNKAEAYLNDLKRAA